MNSQSPPTTGKGIAPCDHTPGEWKADGISGNAVIVSSQWGEIARVVDNGDRAQRDANARLIAASPELIAACKVARQWLIADFSTLSNAEHALLDVPAYRQLCAAIAKAEVTK